MIMEADSGGQILATLPVRYLAATEAALTQLLCDLESITWGEGGLAEDGDTPCDARIYYEVMSRPGGVGGGMGGGLAVDGLWVHDELAERGLIKPHVQRFALEDGMRAYELMRQGRLSGRAVVVP